MTDFPSPRASVEAHNRIVEVFRDYRPEWTKSTMNTVNTLHTQFNEITAQFYGYLPNIPQPSVGHDWITYGMLGFIIIILLRKL